MNFGKAAMTVLVIALFFPVSANKKARVITESGKKWDVLFLKMSSDTIYIKAHKSNGAVFSISGHKSKFRKVEFSDGSLLDFSLSDFPPLESKAKTGESAAAGTSRDTVFLYEPASGPPRQDTVFPAGRNGDASSPMSSSSLKPDSAASAFFASDTSALGTSAERSGPDTEATISIETKPSGAIVKIDGNPLPGTTPLTAKRLSVGEHNIAAFKDSLQASRTISLTNSKKDRVVLILEKIARPAVSIGKKKGRGIAIALGLMSAASFAGSAGTYYLYNKYLPKEEATFNDLNNSVVKGSNAEALIEKNKAQHEDAQMRLNVSQILLGAGALFLATGIVVYF